MINEVRPTKFQMELLGIFHNIIKSVGFNIFMLVLGFSIGFGYMVVRLHIASTRNSNYECIDKIEQSIQDFSLIETVYRSKQQEIDELLKDLKLRLIHDGYNFDTIIK